MAQKKATAKLPDKIDKISDSSEDNMFTSCSSESNTDSSSSDNSGEESDEETAGSRLKVEMPSSSNNKEDAQEGKKSTDLKLMCLHDWDKEKLSACLKKHLSEKGKLPSGIVATADTKTAEATDFTPWWESFIKPKHYNTSRQLKSTQTEDDDSYESWFSKTPQGGTSWLCGPGAQTTSSTSQKSKVEDIAVPSIYDNKPAPKGRRALKRERKAERDKTLGKKWFGMKAPDVDEKLRNDMELIQMRDVLDPKRFYKHRDRKGLPKYFQMGTVVDEGTDFYSSRLTKKQRKQTLVEQLMADANIRQYNKRKYAELQQKMRGKKKFKSKQK